MKITQKVDGWGENPLTNWFNKLIDMPQPVPKGNPFEYKIIPMYLCQSYYNQNDELVDCKCGKCSAETDYPEFKNTGKRISEVEASTPI